MMKHEELTNHLDFVQAEHRQNLRYVRESAVQGIFNEMLRLNKSGIDITLSLVTTHLSVYMHRDGDCTVHDAALNNAEQLIELLRHLEETTGKEEIVDAEAIS